MGWVTLLLIAGVAMAAMVVLGLRKPLWSLAGAALMLGATGYALQGSPGVAGQPAQPELAAEPTDPAILALRDQMLGRWGKDTGYVAAADGLTRAGAKREAVQYVLGGLSHYPNSLLLWTSLGNTLAGHDGGRVSPPALFAFQQAFRLGPRSPAPPFFLGLAYIRGGDFAAARPLWARALAVTPADAPYRGEIAERLRLLDGFMAQGRQGG